MKPQHLIVLIVGSFFCCTTAIAQTTVAAPDDAEALTLLQRMLAAEKTLNVTGDQVTVLYRPEQTFSASQTIEREGDRALRLQYYSPSIVDGEVYVDNGRVAWHSIPSVKELEVGPSELGRVKQESNSIARKLATHQLTVHLVGHDVIAGQIAQVIQVLAAGSWGARKYWIDPVTGAQLKIQTFGALGQMVSETYYTKIDYDQPISGRDFGPPRVDPAFQVVPMTPAGSTTIQTIPTTDDCGFPVTTPSYLPSGFTFQSGFIMPIKGQKLVGLNYENGLVTLSIFEQPITQHSGSPPQPDQYKSPRQNVLVARQNGFKYIVVAALPEPVLEQIVQSMK